MENVEVSNSTILEEVIGNEPVVEVQEVEISKKAVIGAAIVGAFVAVGATFALCKNKIKAKFEKWMAKRLEKKGYWVVSPADAKTVDDFAEIDEDEDKSKK